MTRHEAFVPLHVVDPDHDDGELVVAFDWSGDDFYIMRAAYAVAPDVPIGLDAHERDAVLEWLNESWERQDDGPDPDYERDKRLDDAVLPPSYDDGVEP